ITKYVKGRTRCAVYPSAKYIFDELTVKCAGDYISKHTLEWLDGRLTEFAEAHGYSKDDTFPPSVVLKYKIKKIEQIKQNVIQSSTTSLSELKDHKNTLVLDINELRNEGIELFVTPQNGKIVSAAAENPSFGDDFAEITVETSPEYRGHGFAASNAAALSLALMQKGKIKEIDYCCRESNAASIATALKCGFKLYARTYYFCAYSNM
ncbi:MAG: GNAT family N-acetyltransferase, partial [Eubacteriales bacterium]